MYQGISLDQAPPLSIPFRFFYTAVLFLGLAGLLLALKGQNLFSNISSFETIALVHAFTLGWLMMIMFGAFYQMIPVMIGGRVPLLFLAHFVHLFSSLGVLGLIGFFLHLEVYLLWIGLVGLGLGVSIFLAQCLFAVFRVELAGKATIAAMRASLLSLAGVLLLGVLFLGQFIGLWDSGFEGDQLKSIHALWGLLGWVGLLIMGVSFHLIPMFYVTPPVDSNKSNHMVNLVILSLVLTPLLILISPQSHVFLVGLAFGAAGILLYLDWLFSALKARRRKRLDAVIRAWWIGGFYLLASLVLILPFAGFESEKWGFLLGGVFILGFGVNITLAMLFKIFSFLVWFHKFSNLIGQPGVPMLGDLIPEKAQIQITGFFNLWLLSFFAALLFDEQTILQVLGLALVCLSVRLLQILYKAHFYQIKVEIKPEKS